MPQPRNVTAAADELTALYREANARLIAELEQVVNEPRQVRRTARLRELITSTGTMIDHLEANTQTWITTRLPAIHATGAVAAADKLGSAFQWTQPHIDAIHQLAQRTWENIGPNLLDIRADTLRTLRTLTRDAARQTLIEGSTAVQAGRDLASAAAQQGIGSVVYANGARVPMDAYAETLSRTVSAQSYNNGTITETREFGTEWMEVFDGDECGWTDHDDDDLANGTIRSIDDCDENPISHPNCLRSFGPRPDITSQEEADAAGAEE